MFPLEGLMNQKIFQIINCQLCIKIQKCKIKLIYTNQQNQHSKQPLTFTYFNNNMQTNQVITTNFPQNSNLQKRLQEKNKIIQMLEQKNATLNQQIQRIAKIMEETSKQNNQKSKEQRKIQKIIKVTNDPEIIDRQLKNCYKKIELYQYEVGKLKRKSLSVNTSQKMVGMETQLNQKKCIEDRLKQQLNSLQRQIAQNTKKLSGGSHQQEIQKDLKRKANQLNFFKQMIRQYESKDAIKQKNLKTQYIYIKKIEKTFIQNGGSVNQLDLVKQKALSRFQQGRLRQVTSKQIEEDQYYDRFNKSNSKSIPNKSFLDQNITTVNPQAEFIEQRTRTNYESFQNELKVLQKLNKKYEKQFEQSQKNIKGIEGKFQLTRNRLQRLEKQIQDLNASISLKKTCIVADNMKPTHRRSVRSVNVREDMFNISQVKQPVNKRKRNIVNMTVIAGNTQHRLFHN